MYAVVSLVNYVMRSDDDDRIYVRKLQFERESENLNDLMMYLFNHIHYRYTLLIIFKDSFMELKKEYDAGLPINRDYIYLEKVDNKFYKITSPNPEKFVCDKFTSFINSYNNYRRISKDKLKSICRDRNIKMRFFEFKTKLCIDLANYDVNN